MGRIPEQGTRTTLALTDGLRSPPLRLGRMIIPPAAGATVLLPCRQLGLAHLPRAVRDTLTVHQHGLLGHSFEPCLVQNSFEHFSGSEPAFPHGLVPVGNAQRAESAASVPDANPPANAGIGRARGLRATPAFDNRYAAGLLALPLPPPPEWCANVRLTSLRVTWHASFAVT